MIWSNLVPIEFVLLCWCNFGSWSTRCTSCSGFWIFVKLVGYRHLAVTKLTAYVKHFQWFNGSENLLWKNSNEIQIVSYFTYLCLVKSSRFLGYFVRPWIMTEGKRNYVENWRQSINHSSFLPKPGVGSSCCAFVSSTVFQFRLRRMTWQIVDFPFRQYGVVPPWLGKFFLTASDSLVWQLFSFFANRHLNQTGLN